MKNKGWKDESYRHGLASRGIQSKGWGSESYRHSLAPAQEQEEIPIQEDNETYNYLNELITRASQSSDARVRAMVPMLKEMGAEEDPDDLMMILPSIEQKMDRWE